MANPQKGEVALTLDGQVYTFRLGTGALIELQELMSRTDAPGGVVPLERIFADAAAGRVLAIRALLWAGLRKHHPAVTLEGVDDLLDAASPAEIQALLGSLGASTVPDPADLQALGMDKGGGGPARPRAARGTRAGTGGGSTSTPAASA